MHGYERHEKHILWDAVYQVDGEIPEPKLPDAYRLHSMADEGSEIDRHRKAFEVAFNHPEPKDWPSQISYQGLQQALDYRAEL